ncbi:tetratricopeptide repeat protein [Flavobacterium sp. 3-210]
MKKHHILFVLLLSFKCFAQNDSKSVFQKSRYELAVSYYKKADFKKALDLFSIASKLKPENDLGKESIKKVDTLKTMLRNEVLNRVIGTWKMIGDRPTWAQTVVGTQKETEEIIEITQDKILFFELDKKTQTKRLIKSEELKYYNKDASDGAFSDIILSDGTIWSCLLNEETNVLHVINIAKKNETGIEKITSDNEEAFFVKIK